MKIDISIEKAVRILADEKGNLAVFPYGINPNYQPEENVPPYIPGVGEPRLLPSKTPFELSLPYTTEDLARVIKEGIEAWKKHDPYIEETLLWEEWYYGVKGFKNATKGKKLIHVGWDSYTGIYARLMLPAKSKQCYMGVLSYNFPESVDWIDLAKKVQELLSADLTQSRAYRQYKSRLNL